MNDCESEILNKFSQELEKELTSGILAYWVNNTVDYEKGGFFGRITFNNIPIKDAEKGSVLTARILWAFSASYKMFENTEYEKVAKHAYQYLAEILWDPTYDGVYWMVDADGNPTEDRKHVYAEAFTIYALTEYYSAFKESEALELAKKLYHKIENNCTDAENGGYFEAYSREWELLDDVRLSEKDRNEPKSMNTHLHLLEAYTNLYRHWKSPELKEKLSDLLNIFTRHIMNKDHTSLITFLGKDWTPKSDEISFGHDIETSWLILEAADVLGDYPDYDELVNSCLNLADQVKNKGIDAEYGGIYNEAGPGGIIDDDKDWWPQAEGIVGFMNAYEHTGNTKYLDTALEIWQFIKDYMIDQKYGEWHEKVSRSGTPYQLDKVRSWKCPYHNGRLVLEMLSRINKIQKKAGFKPKSTTVEN